MPNIVVERDRVRVGERFSVSFQRTLRIPDDGHTYPLPPGFGAFPIHRVEEFADRVPEAWRVTSGLFLPMYQHEALWLGFESAWWKPNAIKVGVGRINAITGASWDEALHTDPQDYLTCPPQPWLDGIKSGDGHVRQFVAMPLGLGATVEGQVSGEERFGGIQIAVFEPKPGRFPDLPPDDCQWPMAAVAAAPSQEMGIAAGGEISQKVYPDPHGFDVWDQTSRVSLFIHILNSLQYQALTGAPPPISPITARTYTQYGFPWFSLNDDAATDLPAGEILKEVQSIRELQEHREGEPKPEPETVVIPESQVKKLGNPEI